MRCFMRQRRLCWKKHKTAFSSGAYFCVGQLLVKPGYIESKFHKYFTEAFDLRQESDYQPLVEVTEQQVGKVLERAKEFVEICRNLCR